MSVTQVNKSAFHGIVPCFQVQPVQNEVMGYMLENAPAEGKIVPQGTPIYADMRAKTAKICKYAVVEKKVDTKNFVVKSVGLLSVGDKVYASKEGAAVLSTISAIDEKTNTITLSAANSEIAAGSVLVEGSAAGTPVAVPNRIVATRAIMRATDKTVNAAFKAIAILNVLNYPDEWLNETAFPGSILLKGNPHIMFVTQ